MDNSEILDRLDLLLPDLIQMRDRLNKTIIDIRSFNSEEITIDEKRMYIVRRCILDYYDITAEQLKGDSRKGYPMKARHIYCAIVKNITGLSYERIGISINKDRGTVRHSCKVINNARDTDDILYDHYKDIMKSITFLLGDKNKQR